MSKRNLRVLVPLASVCAALAVVGCGGGSYSGSNGGSNNKSSSNSSSGGSSTSGGQGGGGDVTVNTSVAPSTLDPASGCGTTDLAIAGNLYTRLTQYGTAPGPSGTKRFDPGNIQPYLATWKTSADGKTYTFTLKDGLKFPSGKPLDSAAVKYSIERVLKINGCGVFFVIDGIQGLIKSIETPDPTTVVFKLSRADANFPQAMAQPAAGVVDKSVVDAHGGDQANKPNQYLASHSAGAGPFLLSSYEPNKQAVLTRNPDYKATPAVAASKLTINFINSDPTLLLQARSGTADLTIGLTKQSAHSLAGNGNVTVVADTSPLSEQIGMLNTKPPFNNKTFREAMTYAIPYQEILQKVAFGYGKLFYGPLQPVFAEFNPKLSAPRSYDLAKAKQLVQQSGVKTPVNVTMIVQEGNTTDQQIATIAQGEWKKLGVNVTVRTLSASEYQDSVEGHKYQSYVRLDGPGVVDPGYYLDYDAVCKVSFNLTEACVPQNDKLLGQARLESDEAKRKAIYDQITKNWVAQSPKIQVYADDTVVALAKGVTGYVYSHEADFRTLAKSGH
jgi:peptide/nickel transport system substrate-binding protein